MIYYHRKQESKKDLPFRTAPCISTPSPIPPIIHPQTCPSSPLTTPRPQSPRVPTACFQLDTTPSNRAPFLSPSQQSVEKPTSDSPPIQVPIARPEASADRSQQFQTSPIQSPTHAAPPKRRFIHMSRTSATAGRRSRQVMQEARNAREATTKSPHNHPITSPDKINVHRVACQAGPSRWVD